MIPKFNYKIFDKREKTYFSGCKKSTWSQKAAVINFINEKITARNIRSSYNYNYTPSPTRTIDEIEVHIFPIADAIVKSASDFLTENKDEIKAKIDKKAETERKHEVARKKNRVEQLERELKETQAELNRLKK